MNIIFFLDNLWLKVYTGCVQCMLKGISELTEGVKAKLAGSVFLCLTACRFQLASQILFFCCLSSFSLDTPGEDLFAVSGKERHW